MKLFLRVVSAVAGAVTVDELRQLISRYVEGE